MVGDGGTAPPSFRPTLPAFGQERLIYLIQSPSVKVLLPAGVSETSQEFSRSLNHWHAFKPNGTVPETTLLAAASNDICSELNYIYVGDISTNGMKSPARDD